MQIKSYYIKSIVAAVGMTCLLDVSASGGWPLVFCGLFLVCFKRDILAEKRMLCCVNVCAFIFACFSVLVKVEEYVTSEFYVPGVVKIFLCFMACYWFYQRCLLKIYIWFEQCENKVFCNSLVKNKSFFWIVFGSVLLVWIPYYLAFYPAVMSFDSLEQAKQMLGVSPYSNHHPMLHTLSLKMIYSIAKNFVVSEIAAFGIICAVQMILLALVFSLTIYWAYQKGIKRSILALVWAFYALLPYQGLHSVTLWKDVWFAGVVLVFVLMIFIYYYNYPKEKKGKILLHVLITLLGCGVCLMRSNGYYAFLVFLIIIGVCEYKKSKYFILSLGLAFAAATLIKGPVYDKFNIIPGDIVEELSIPIQNIGFVVVEGKELTTEEYELLSNVVNVEEIPNHYKKNISDPLKLLIRFEDNLEYLEENKVEYLKLWIKLGMRYPLSYLISWVNQTAGYWHPEYTQKVHFTKLSDNELGISRKSSVLEDMMEKWINGWIEVPLLGSLFCMGTYIWALFLISGYVIYRKKWDVLKIYSLAFGIWFTLLIASPTAYSFRYLYAVIVSIPLLIMMAFVNYKEAEDAR